MKILKKITFIRDLIFFVLLMFLLGYMAQRANKFIYLHQASLIHELDPIFLNKIYDAQKRIQSIEKHYKKQNAQRTIYIQHLTKKLHSIEKQYTHNSHALALLGPIGTTAIVLKEQHLAKQLSLITKKINTIEHELHLSTKST